MTANEKRAQHVLDLLACDDGDGVGVAIVSQELDAAEKRVEERVLRMIRSFARGVDPHDSVAHSILAEYRRARKGGKR